MNCHAGIQDLYVEGKRKYKLGKYFIKRINPSTAIHRTSVVFELQLHKRKKNRIRMNLKKNYDIYRLRLPVQYTHELRN